MRWIIAFSLDESGAPAVEYAFLLALIAIAIASGLKSFGEAVKSLFDTAGGSFSS
ncbi:MAG: Flp family type IVb pilin [Desulfobaccales bacterium]